MTSPERDPRIVLRADVAAYVAAMRSAQDATARLSMETRTALGKVTASWVAADKAAAAYAKAAGLAAAASPVRGLPAAGRAAGAATGASAGAAAADSATASILARQRADQALARSEANVEKANAAVARSTSAVTEGNAGAAASARAVSLAYETQAAAEMRLSEAHAAVAAGASMEAREEVILAAAAARTAAAQTQATLAAERRVAAETAVAGAIEREAAAERSAAFARATAGARAAGVPYGPITATQHAAVQAENARIAAALQADMARASAAADAAAARGAAAAEAGSARALRAAEGLAAGQAALAARAAAAEEAGAARRVTALRSVGFAAAATGTIMLAGFALTARAAAKWESDFAGVQKVLTNETKDQLAVLEKGLREMSKTLPVSHQVLADVMSQSAQLGIPTSKLLEFTKVAIELSATTNNLTADMAATSLAKFTNIMGSAGTEATRLGAALVALGNNGAGTEADILNMSVRIAGAGHIVGLTATQVLALANTMTSLGIRSELGGTAMQRVLFKMYTAVDQGTSKLSAFQKAFTLGGGVGAFGATFKSDPAQALSAVTAGLKKASEAGTGYTKMLDQMGIKNANDVRVLTTVADGHDQLTKSLKIGADAYKAGTALEEAFAARAKTTASQVQLMKNEVNDAAITFGQTLLPAVVALAHGVGGLANALQSMPEPLRVFVTVLGTGVGTAALLGGVILLLVGRFAALRVAMLEAGGAARVMWLAIAGPVGLTIGVLLGLGAASTALNSAMRGHTDIDAYATSLTEFAKSGKLAGAALAAVGPDFTKFEDAIKGGNKWARMAREDLNLAIPFVHLGDLTMGPDPVVRQFEDMDAALAKMVGSGNATQAKAMFEKFGKDWTDQGKKLDEFTKKFPHYADALKMAGDASKSAGDTITLMNGDVVAASDEFANATVNIGAFTKELKGLEADYFGLTKAQDDVTAKVAAINAEQEKTAAGTDYLGSRVSATKVSLDEAGKAADAYAAKLAAMRGDSTSASKGLFDQARAADAMQTALHNLTGDTKATTDAVSSLADVLDKTFGNTDAVDAFDAKVAEIKKRIAEGPGKGIQVDLSMTGSTEAARQARADAEELFRHEADLMNRDVLDGKAPAAAAAARRTELQQTLTDIGFYTDDIAGLLAKFDEIPAGILGVTDKAGKSAKALSHDLTSNTQDAIDNRNKLRDLVESTRDDITTESKGMTQAQITALVKQKQTDLRKQLTTAGYSASDLDPYLSKLTAPTAASKSLTGQTESSRQNREDVRALVAMTKDQIDQELKVGMTKKQVTAVVEKHTKKLNDDLKAMGYSASAAGDLEAGLRGIPDAYMATSKSAKDATTAMVDNNQTARDLFHSMALQLAQTDPSKFKAAFAADRDLLGKELDILGVSKKVHDEIFGAFDELPGRILASSAATKSAFDTAIDAAKRKVADFRAEIESTKGKVKTPVEFEARWDSLRNGISEVVRAYQNAKNAVEGHPVHLGADGSSALSEVDKVRTGLLEKLKAGHLWDFTVGANTAPVDTSIDAMRKRINAGGDLHVGVNANTPDLGLWRNDVQKNFDTWPLRLHIVPQVNDPATATGFTIAKPTQAPVGVFKPVKKAAGGWIPGTGRPTADDVPVWASSREFMVQARYAGPNADLLEAVNAGRRVVVTSVDGRQLPGSAHASSAAVRRAGGGWVGKAAARQVDTRHGFTAQVPVRSFTDLHRAPAVAPRVAPVDYERIITGIAAAIDSRPVQVASTLNLDGKVVARSLGDVANQRTRTR